MNYGPGWEKAAVSYLRRNRLRRDGEGKRVFFVLLFILAVVMATAILTLKYS